MVAGLLAATLIRSGIGGGARESSLLGWPAEAMLATAGAVAGIGLALGLESIGGADYDPAKWWRFELVVYQPHGMGDGTGVPRWGSFTWGDGTRWGGLPHDRVELLRRIVRKWKPAHAQCLRVKVVLSGALWGDGWRWGDGTTWGGVTVSFSL